MNVKLHPVSVGHVDLRLSYELALRAFVVIWLLPTVVVISEAAERLLPHRSLSLSVCLSRPLQAITSLLTNNRKSYLLTSRRIYAG